MNKPVRIAILDLYEGKANQGMRCIREIIRDWAEMIDQKIESQEFDVRLKNELPDNSFDIYISSGGPGDPLISRFEDWDINWCRWVGEMLRFNDNPANSRKKQVFFICHSFPSINYGWAGSPGSPGCQPHRMDRASHQIPVHFSRHPAYEPGTRRRR